VAEHLRRRQSRAALLAGALLALAWLAVPAEACLAALAQLPSGYADESAAACLACTDEGTSAVGAGHRHCDAAGCVAAAMPPCPAGLGGMPAGGGQPPVAASRVGLRLPVSDPHSAPVLPDPPPQVAHAYLDCCVLLI